MMDFTQLAGDASMAQVMRPLPGLIAGFPAGFVAGLIHFHSLHLVTQRLLAGNVFAIGLQLVRFVTLGAALYSLLRVGGPTALIAGTGGVLLARARVLARLGTAP